MRLEGIVVPGKGIASGKNIDPETNLTNTIFLQKPFFERAGVEDIDKVNNGTINLDISPKKFKIEQPDYEVECEWVPGVRETFRLVKANIIFDSQQYAGFIYYPMPSLIKSHPDNKIELLAPKISELNYGDALEIIASKDKITLY